MKTEKHSQLTNYDMPDFWTKTTLNEICLPTKQVKPREIFKDPFRYIEVNGVDSKTKKIVLSRSINPKKSPSRAKQLVRAGDVVFSNVRVYLENIALVPEDLDGQIASTAFTVLRPATGIDPKFLFYFTVAKTFIRELIRLQRGNSPPSVLDEDVKSQPVRLPPEKEQNRISSKVEELFSALDKGETELKRAQALIQRYRQSVLKAAVTGELTRKWREENADRLESGEALLKRILKARREAWEKTELARMKAKGQKPKDDKWKGKYKEPLKAVISNLYELPKGWVWATVDQVITEPLRTGLSIKGSAEPPGVGSLKLNALTDFGINFEAVKFLKVNRVDVEPIKIKSGDFFISRGNGSLNLLGKGALSTTPPSFTIYPDIMIRLRFNREISDSKYVFSIWNGRHIRSQIEKMAKTTAGIYKISQSQVCSIIFPLPPLEEQRIISLKISSLMDYVKNLEKNLLDSQRDLNFLRQSILKSAFSGQLVPQDPNDEPASELLKRIAEERARVESTKLKPTRRRRKKKKV